MPSIDEIITFALNIRIFFNRNIVHIGNQRVRVTFHLKNFDQQPPVNDIRNGEQYKKIERASLIPFWSFAECTIYKYSAVLSDAHILGSLAR